MSLEASVRAARNGFRLDVELNVPSGQTVAVVGPNGAGKSTLLRALAGLVPMEGRVVLDGETIDNLPTEKRRIGLVFQDHVLFPHLTTLENIAFGLRAHKRTDATAKARSLLDASGLGAKAGSLPKELSGGQAQRVALLRALATEPRLLLLDEPLSALDVSVRAEVRRDLARQLASYTGVRILVTHDPVDAIALADRLVVLEDGHVIQTGTPADVTAQPRSRFAADLAGVNLLRGTAHGDRIELVGGATLAAASAGIGEVFAVIHPRAVALYKSRPEGTPRNVWAGRAEDLDARDDRVRVRVTGAIPLVAEVTQGAVRELGLAGGSEVWVSIKATEVSVYPA